jgi:hydroxylaminobenzene mutase
MMGPMAYGTGHGGGGVGSSPAAQPPPLGPWGFVPAPAARPRPSTVARWSLLLGITGMLTAPLLGGIVPGLLAVILASSGRRELVAAEGWLTGHRQLAAGRVLGLTAVWVALTVAVALTVQWLLGLGDAAVHPVFPDDVE